MQPGGHISDIFCLSQRDCPVCGEAADMARLFLPGSMDAARVTKASFASRKVPEFMSFRLACCHRCATVFATEAPDAAALARAYHEADYSSAAEAALAAEVYREALAPHLTDMTDRGTALEIGTGTGVFLAQLRKLGFRYQIGIEPSMAAIDAATDDVKPAIRHGVFTDTSAPDDSLSLICCFQTLEHVHDPRLLIEQAFRMLQPGGKVALITHDYHAPINRLLGRRSPIIDIEHMQLFCPQSLRYLIDAAGFVQPRIKPIRNTYPLRYWLSLLPISGWPRRMLLACVRRLRLDAAPVSFNVGNLLAVAQKPR